jgi:hypothetical protein
MDRPVDMPTWSQSIFIAASTADLYAMVSDVTRMGEWSPVCRWCRWDDDALPASGAGPAAGAWFTGHNVDEEREWDTHCEVLVAEPGHEFTFGVAGTFVRWSYRFQLADSAGDGTGASGTRLTETWEPQPDLLAFYATQYGEDQVETVLAARADAAKRGIDATLHAIKRVAEGS